jgi:hypothetical protein
MQAHRPQSMTWPSLIVEQGRVLEARVFQNCRRSANLNWLPAIAITMVVAAAYAQEQPDPTYPTQPATQPAAQPTTPPDATQQPTDAPPADEGPAYPISALNLRYVRENPDHPPIETLGNLEVELGFTPQGYVAPRPGLTIVRITPASVAQRGTEIYHASALQRILETIRDYLNSQQLLGVYVAPDLLQISDVGQDYRAEGQTGLDIVISTGVVTELRTLASGERVSEKGPIHPEDRVNNPVHARIRERSPIKPSSAGDPQTGDLLRKDILDRYLYWLSRHPGRRVDASVAAGEEVGGVALDYQVTENKPLTFYAQLSNNGTKSTDYLRQRFGFYHNQLTNHDDIISFDFITAWFDETNAAIASYERPFDDDRIRWRVFGNWSQFKADQVGFFGDEFEGESWAVGGEIIANIYQENELFLDIVGGARYENIQVNNQAFLIEGEEAFIIPYVALRMDRVTEWYATIGSVGLEFWTTNANEAELAALGRTDPDTDSAIFQGSVSQALYLEPLINRKGWEDPSTPDDSTLAHELIGSLRGQYSFGNRLIPQAEQVVGGMYSVRGYPESIVAGDDIIVASIEYRYHLPRALGLEPEPRELFGKPFRVAPQYVYGVPDWDLVGKAFLDYGHTYNSDRLSFEQDDDLLGIGIGLDFIYKRNLNVRLDWGFAMEPLDSGPVNSGSNRLHFAVTVIF